MKSKKSNLTGLNFLPSEGSKKENVIIEHPPPRQLLGITNILTYCCNWSDLCALDCLQYRGYIQLLQVYEKQIFKKMNFTSWCCRQGVKGVASILKWMVNYMYSQRLWNSRGANSSEFHISSVHTNISVMSLLSTILFVPWITDN